MASHLTVTTTSAGVSSSKGLSASADAAAEAGDVFAALLGLAGPQGGSDAARTSSAKADLNLGNAIKLSLGFGEGDGDKSQDPEAIAAVIDAVVPIQDTLQAVPVLADIAKGLADLKAKLAAGELLDPAALKQLNAALSDLAAALDIDLKALPTLNDLTAMVTDIQPDDTSFAARLTAAFGPLAETLFSGTAAPAADVGTELSQLTKSIGDKLAALLVALNGGDLDADRMAQLEQGAAADADIEAALAKLLVSTMAVKTGDAAPALAAPTLKLTEPALTGKAAAAADAPTTAPTSGQATQTATATAPVQAAADGSADQTDRGNDNAAPDRKPAEPNPAPLTAAIDRQPEPQAATQATPTARVDVVAAPRVVQAGYQTSQQQLNLPQLAFELVRQVTDGNTRFQMRLDPPELGRIDVRLDIDKAGQVHARLTVEKAETLDLMQRDQRGLERALQQAGLDGAKTNLEFSLKQSPFSGQQGQGQGGGDDRNPIFGDDGAADADATPPPTINLYRGSLSASGVNIIA